MDALDLKRLLRNKLKGTLPKRFAVVACHVLWREISYCASQLSHSYDFYFIEQGLHDVPSQLQAKIQHHIETLRAEDYEAVLLGFGLCSKGTLGITARELPVVIFRVHDCISIFLGGKTRYNAQFATHPGTMWFTSGWIEDAIMPGVERENAIREIFNEIYGEENAQFIIASSENWKQQYSRAVFINTHIGNVDWAREFTKRTAEYYGWEFAELDADFGLLTRWLNGTWDNSDEFLVIYPGQSVAQSFDDKIIVSTSTTPG